MELQSLTPATQAVLKALAELGQGNVHELAEKSGKARSTTDKAIRTLAEAGLIVEVDLGADPAEGTPARWTLSEDTAAALGTADLTDEAMAGLDETGDNPGSGVTDDEPDDGNNDPLSDDDSRTNDEPDNRQEPSDEDTADSEGKPDDQDDTDALAEVGPRPPVVAASRPGDRKVMAIKGVLADHGEDGATVDMIVADSGISHPTTIRLLAAMEQADAARRLPGLQHRWISGPTKASEVDPNPEPPRCALCFQVIRGVTSTPEAVAAVQRLIRPDGTLHVVGPDDQTHVVALPTRLPPRSLNASPSTIGQRGDQSVNADGNQPFARGELERLTIDVLAANPGRAMTPQEIATAISAQLDGRKVSSGAVRNNCTKAAATGSSIQLVSDAPLAFMFPAPESGHADAKEVDGEQPAADTEREADTAAEPDGNLGETDQS